MATTEPLETLEEKVYDLSADTREFMVDQLTICWRVLCETDACFAYYGPGGTLELALYNDLQDAKGHIRRGLERLDAEPPKVVEHLGLKIKTQPKADWDRGFLCTLAATTMAEQKRAAAEWEEAMR